MRRGSLPLLLLTLALGACQDDILCPSGRSHRASPAARWVPPRTLIPLSSSRNDPASMSTSGSPGLESTPRTRRSAMAHFNFPDRTRRALRAAGTREWNDE